MKRVKIIDAIMGTGKTDDAIEKKKKERPKSSHVANHYYILEGIGRFENMKDLRMFLGVSREAIRKLMHRKVIKKIMNSSQELQNVEENEEENNTRI